MNSIMRKRRLYVGVLVFILVMVGGLNVCGANDPTFIMVERGYVVQTNMVVMVPQTIVYVPMVNHTVSYYYPVAPLIQVVPMVGIVPGYRVGLFHRQRVPVGVPVYFYGNNY